MSFQILFLKLGLEPEEDSNKVESIKLLPDIFLRPEIGSGFSLYNGRSLKWIFKLANRLNRWSIGNICMWKEQ